MKKSVSEELMDDLEPIYSLIEDAHPTEHDESDELEAAKNTSEKIVSESQPHSSTS